MFSVIYEFEVNEQHVNEFKEVWHQLTLVTAKTRGGLGSRLHKETTKENIWIAYAQWPNENEWKKHNPLTEATDTELRERMKQVCSNIRIIYQLNVIDDLLMQ